MSETVFVQVNYDLGSLMKYIEMGDIGLPDIQRPFVWKNAKVRDLFDSMYQGYPVGYLLFWQNGFSDEHRTIGTDDKQVSSRLLIVDGQQRLTSLYAVIKSIPVVRENYSSEKIQISFNPLTEKFEVADAAVTRNKAYIPDISVIWKNRSNIFIVVEEYLENIQSTREITGDEKQQIQSAISKLANLLSFPFTALELSAKINEEQVGEVFVRINSQGKTLNQADFILTLMSVFWDEGRTQLEKFCQDSREPTQGKASSFNYYIQPDPSQLLRVCVGLGFNRARLKYVYSILRGKDLETEKFSDELRDKQFGILKTSQAKVLDLSNWHEYLKIIRQAGTLSAKAISSKTNLMVCYILYLIGKTEYKIDGHVLRQHLARWYFMSSLTGRYTGSPESAMEFDLSKFREVTDPNEFLSILEEIRNTKLTTDYWKISLPSTLATSSPSSPSLFAYYAGLVLMDAKVLFSQQKVKDLLDPAINSTRYALERHHLFPKNYLTTLGITEIRDTNQIANFAFVEWSDNNKISDKPPAEYVPMMKERFSEAELEEMYYWHALPKDWEKMDYREFLVQRRELIAKVIFDAYQILIKGTDLNKTEGEIDLNKLIESGEDSFTEFKATLRVNLHTGEKDSRMEHAILKTIAGFLNANGGKLFIGVADNTTPVGIENDLFESEDKMNLHLVNLIKSKIGPQFMMYVNPMFDDFENHRIMVVECHASKVPVYLKDGNIERFYIRTGSSTSELLISQVQDYISQRF